MTLSAALPAPTKTTCPYCGVGCGVLVRRRAGKVSVKGDPDHPANFGRLCSKGSALGETLDLEGRLLNPMIGEKQTGWDEALDLVAKKFSETIAAHGPDSVAFYVSGQLLTEDYYVVNKLAKGFIGTANIDTNSRLCMASSVAGHKRAFGADVVPGCYEDLEQADLLVLTGSNAAWCHPVLYQRMMAAKEKNPALRVVVIDPRRTETVEGADLHLALRSGSDAVLFNGLLAYLAQAGCANTDFLEHVLGAAAAIAAAGAPDIARIARVCGLADGHVQLFFDWFAKTRKVVTLYSQGINQSSSGTDKVNAILNCHLFTGRIGRPGMGPFSLTGQPNAMGGREVGGLANQLAAHMELENPAHRDLVRRFWDAPNVAQRAGLKAVEMFQAIEAGIIKAVWIISTNPLVSLPDAEQARRALENCEFVVVSDILRQTDTTKFAHIRLPATGWGEKSGTVTNSERRISRQRSFLPIPGEARPDWQIVAQVAQRMGYSGFDFPTEAEIFAEHAALSAFENNGTRDFDLSGLTILSTPDYDSLAPTQWPIHAQGAVTQRLFADGQFFTPDRRARMVPIVPRPPKNPTSAGFDMVLNTGRVRDHWHTLTRTGKSPRLSAHIFEPCAEIHPEDARRLKLRPGDMVRLTSAGGSMVLRAQIATTQRRGCVFVPMHWSAQFSSQGAINRLVNSATDPHSGQPEFKHTPVRAEPVRPKWQAVLFTRTPVAPPPNTHWLRGRAGQAQRMELWSDIALENPDELATILIGTHSSYRDASGGHYRYFNTQGDDLNACLFIAPDDSLPSRAWLTGLFAAPLRAGERMSLLAGRALDASQDSGEIICACFSVGRKQIDASIRAGANTVQDLGARVKAGTNCGSCKTQLARILTESRQLEKITG